MSELNPEKNAANEWSRIVTLCLSLVLAVIVLQRLFSDTKDFSAFDLGTTTTPNFAKRDELIIHFSKPDTLAEMPLVRAIEQSVMPAVLVLGNSQTHGINRFAEGQTNVVFMLNKAERDKAFVFGHSLANANLQELYILFRHWTATIGLKCVLIPVFLDDTREDFLRSDLAEYRKLASQLNSDLPIDKLLSEQLQSFTAGPTASEVSDAPPQIESPTLQDLTEAWLNAKLSERSRLWAKRPTVRGELFVTMYRARNSLLRVSSQTKRRSIPGPYGRNFAALEALIGYAEAREIKVLVYVPPLRQDVVPPYELSEYAEFKKKVQSLVKDHSNVLYADLDSIVPSELWGMKDSTNLSGKPEYDFMHFSYEGHQLLFQALAPLVEKMLQQP